MYIYIIGPKTVAREYREPFGIEQQKVDGNEQLKPGRKNGLSEKSKYFRFPIRSHVSLCFTVPFPRYENIDIDRTPSLVYEKLWIFINKFLQTGREQCSTRIRWQWQAVKNSYRTLRQMVWLGDAIKITLHNWLRIRWSDIANGGVRSGALSAKMSINHQATKNWLYFIANSLNARHSETAP